MTTQELKLSDPLKLKYAFISEPNPIRVSPEVGVNSFINLKVIISNPGTKSLELEKIYITIPVGENTARALSSEPDLPSPVDDPSGKWTISSKGSIVTIAPKEDDFQIVTNNIVFELKGIEVNKTVGIVPINIIERLYESKAAENNTLYSLLKLEADFPVVNFHAAPDTIYDLERSVTLYWQCSVDEYRFKLHSKDWNPSEFYTPDDGKRGVQTPALSETTTFTLDIIKGGENYGRLETTVHVEVPRISENSSIDLFFGSIVRLKWLAFNASKCSILLDGETIEENAPVDTYLQGYTMCPFNQAGTYIMSLVAHAKMGEATATRNFQPLKVKDHDGIELKDGLLNMVSTPDGKYALVLSYMNDWDTQVTIINIADKKMQTQIPLGAGGALISFAVSPNGKFALVSLSRSEGVIVIDIKSQSVKTFIETGEVVLSTYFTPDGKFAILPTVENSIKVIDMNSLKVDSDIPFKHTNGLKAHITPNGEYAFMFDYGNYPCHTLFVLDIRNRKMGQPIKLDVTEIPCMDITPDGKLALVGTYYPDGIIVVDIPGLKVKERIKWEGHCGSIKKIKVTPDGKLAFVVDLFLNTVIVIDILNKKLDFKITHLGGPTDVVFSKDGKLAFILNESNPLVYVVDIPARKVISRDYADSRTVNVTEKNFIFVDYNSNPVKLKIL